VLIATIFLLLTNTVSADRSLWDIIATVSEQCKGEYINKKLTPEELDVIITKIKKDKKGNLCGADLSNIDLSRMKLENVDFSTAKMIFANLSNVSLDNVNLMGANLSGANLTDANLSILPAKLSGAALDNAIMRGVNLQGVDASYTSLWHANLVDANLTYTNFKGAVLINANLSGATMLGTDLTDADVMLANIYDVMFEPEELPDIDKIALTYNLGHMTFMLGPHALVKLRNEFEEAGYREQERAVTFAIKHTENLTLYTGGTISQPIRAAFEYVFFEFITFWGAVPERALFLLLYLIPIFSLPLYYCGALSERRRYLV